MPPQRLVVGPRVGIDYAAEADRYREAIRSGPERIATLVARAQAIECFQPKSLKSEEVDSKIRDSGAELTIADGAEGRTWIGDLEYRLEGDVVEIHV